MDNLLFRFTPGQLRGLRVSTVVLAALTAGLAAMAHFRFGWSSPVQGWTSAAGVSCLLGLWGSVTSARAFTECSADGIRRRGFFGLGVRSCPWAQVGKIGIVNLRGTRMIMVTRRDGSSFHLDVPRHGGVMLDRDFDVKFGQVSSYWQLVASPRLPGLPPAVEDSC